MRHWFSVLFIAIIVASGICQAVAPKVDLISATIDDKPLLGMHIDNVIKSMGEPELKTIGDNWTQLWYLDLGLMMLFSHTTRTCSNASVALADTRWGFATGDVAVKAAKLPFGANDSVEDISAKVGKSNKVYKSGPTTFVTWEISGGWCTLFYQQKSLTIAKNRLD